MQPKRKLNFYILALALIVGCSTVGQVIPPEKRIPLEEGGPHSDIWSSFDCVMNYQYQMTRPEPASPGKLTLKGSVQGKNRSLDSLSISVNFLDAGGKVLQRKSVYTSGYRVENPDRSFQLSLDTPPGAVAISFGSKAQARTGSRGGR